VLGSATEANSRAGGPTFWGAVRNCQTEKEWYA
jgi:hypothetical protein